MVAVAFEKTKKGGALREISPHYKDATPIQVFLVLLFVYIRIVRNVILEWQRTTKEWFNDP